jgi:hypothetical protein
VKELNKKILHWTPRAISILFVLFISMFAFDTPGIGFLIHLIPSIILLGLIILAWKYELIGGIAFIVLGIVFTIFFKTYKDIITILLISLPPIITGVLFILNKRFSMKNQQVNKKKKEK